ncbi:hypothetical protein BS47DRAFT_1397427 [Hydnum rufescens UP504]|uniref:Uncharacterized protein n=1 Tax=Hydnum rufescens UP504 TaxID=1448309 RepID=A0A9P6AN16_9AGAM|nr:hypothetical protein BS47DRAFT_1397427 [Hydnum rufescens UP504]
MSTFSPSMDSIGYYRNIVQDLQLKLFESKWTQLKGERNKYEFTDLPWTLPSSPDCEFVKFDSNEDNGCDYPSPPISFLGPTLTPCEFPHLMSTFFPAPHVNALQVPAPRINALRVSQPHVNIFQVPLKSPSIPVRYFKSHSTSHISLTTYFNSRNISQILLNSCDIFQVPLTFCDISLSPSRVSLDSHESFSTPATFLKSFSPFMTYIRVPPNSRNIS